MVGAPELEIYGPFAEHEAIRNAFIDAGRAFGMHLIGTHAYFNNPLESGWMPVPVAAIYSGESTATFRQWLDASKPLPLYSVEGSFTSDVIEDYYVTPFDLGYDKLIKYDHKFIGATALAKKRGECVPAQGDRGDERSTVSYGQVMICSHLPLPKNSPRVNIIIDK